MDRETRRFDRYQRLRIRRSREYVHAIAPGPTPETIMVSMGNMMATILPLPRRLLRPLRWYERLLNR
jgi:hypothetical protein